MKAKAIIVSYSERSTRLTKNYPSPPNPQRGKEILFRWLIGKTVKLSPTAPFRGEATILDGYTENGYARYVVAIKGNRGQEVIRERDIDMDFTDYYTAHQEREELFNSFASGRI